MGIFSCDLLLFYILPLIVAVIGCYKIGQALRKNANSFSFLTTHQQRRSKVMRVRLPSESLEESVVLTTQHTSSYQNHTTCTVQRHVASHSPKSQVHDKSRALDRDQFLGEYNRTPDSCYVSIHSSLSIRCNYRVYKYWWRRSCFSQSHGCPSEASSFIT